MLHNADAVTACSEYVMRDLASEGHIRGSSSVIPNGVDPREFQAESEASGDPAGDPYVLAVGRLVPQKGFDLLLDAFRSSRLTGLNLVFAGDGFERQRLEAQAAEIGLSARVRFLGSVTRPRLAALLRGAHAFAFPSRGEAFGIALLEAMAAGVPAVAAAAGGVPELAADGYNALVVHPEDATALAAALDRVASDAGLRERLIAGGLETASQLEWSKIAGRYEDVYREALGGGGA
jgi:glycosyltransferase involved in cell wall biosynthesis